MTVGDIKEKLGLKALCENEDSLSREVTGGYCGDLLSWVMSRAKAGDAWMTVMGNVNSIGVAAKRSALSDVDFHVRSGQTVGIIGGTGSSKTSLVQLICRLYDVTDGSVRVGGVDVRQYDLETLRNQVAVVLQKNVLFSGTIKENLRWGDANASDEELQRACELACADEFIQQMPDKYDTYIEQGGTNVSGGQKQRLSCRRELFAAASVLAEEIIKFD